MASGSSMPIEVDLVRVRSAPDMHSSGEDCSDTNVLNMMV